MILILFISAFSRDDCHFLEISFHKPKHLCSKCNSSTYILTVMPSRLLKYTATNLFLSASTFFPLSTGSAYEWFCAGSMWLNCKFPRKLFFVYLQIRASQKRDLHEIWKVWSTIADIILWRSLGRDELQGRCICTSGFNIFLALLVWNECKGSGKFHFPCFLLCGTSSWMSVVLTNSDSRPSSRCRSYRFCSLPH